MKLRALCLALLLLPVVAAAKTELAATPVAPTERQAVVTRWIAQLLSNSKFHYSPKSLDNALSAQIFDAYFDALDNERLFFLAADIEKFAPLREGFDDALRSRELLPAFDVFNTYVQRVSERTDYARRQLKREFDFTGNASFETERDKAPWAKSRQQLDALWHGRIMNDVLRLKLAGKDMPAIRETLDKRYLNFEKRLHEVDAEDVFQTFINAYASAIEPHTAYMNARASENFNISMRLSLEGIGAVLQRDEEYTVVRSVVPGGPAALSGVLKVGDRIVGVGQGREGPLVDVVGWRIDEVVELIRGPKDSLVRLDLVPATAGPDGKHELLALTRDKVKLEEQAAKKTVLELPDGERRRRVGVIELPTFYQDFDGRRRDEPEYRSATRDIARLLDQLKSENVEGVVIDLRNNGGGSLTEAVELTGLFINLGAVVQVRDSTERVLVERDVKSGTAWEGPLAVLVNRASASASEIFAGAIQDYGRGLIIGEPTFGKGTVQNLVDLDRFNGNEAPGLGQLRLTVAQFFRVSGGSTQHKGVVPDIGFPVTLDAGDYGESAYENALPWTRIDPVAHDRFAEYAQLLPLLEQRHAARAGTDPEFRWWSEDVAEYRRLREQTSISLNFDRRKQERDAAADRRKEREEQRKALGTGTGFAAANEPEPDDGLQADERDPQTPPGAGKTPPPDPLLREAARILVDSVDLLRDDRRLAALVHPDREAAKSD
jgi:carboxyl-terminal processing protease